MTVTINGSNTPTAGGVTYGDGTQYATTSAGTSGQVLLSAGSSAPTWGAVSAATGLTGVLPVANGGTNSTATPTAGGVGYGTGTAHAYTSAGTTGQVLTSAGASAPTWATPATGAMTLLATVTASTSASVTFNSTYITSTYFAYMIVFAGWVPDVDRPQYRIELSTDNLSTSVTCNYITVRADSGGPATVGCTTAATVPITNGTFSTSTSNGGGSGYIYIYNPSNTSFGRGINWILGGYSTNSTNQEHWYGSATYKNTTSAINAVRLTVNGGNILTGVFKLYGIASS